MNPVETIIIFPTMCFLPTLLTKDSNSKETAEVEEKKGKETTKQPAPSSCANSVHALNKPLKIVSQPTGESELEVYCLRWLRCYRYQHQTHVCRAKDWLMVRRFIIYVWLLLCDLFLNLCQIWRKWIDKSGDIQTQLFRANLFFLI